MPRRRFDERRVSGRARPLAAACLALFPVAAIAAGDPVSAYTKHDYEKCRLITKDVASQTRRCQGLVGIVVNYRNDDDSSVVDFGTRGLVGEASFGAGFVFAGQTIEWRGLRERGGFKPYAAILRFDVGPSVGGPFHSRLIVFRLEGNTRSCLVASVDGRKPDANLRARELADQARSFDCAKDKMRIVD